MDNSKLQVADPSHQRWTETRIILVDLRIPVDVLALPTGLAPCPPGRRTVSGGRPGRVRPDPAVTATQPVVSRPASVMMSQEPDTAATAKKHAPDVELRDAELHIDSLAMS